MIGVTIQINTQEMQYDADLPDAGLWSIIVRESINQNIVTVYVGGNPWTSTSLDTGIYTVTGNRIDTEGTAIGPILKRRFIITPDLVAFTVIELTSICDAT